MYHISDLKKFSKCPRYYFLDANSENSFQPYLRSDESYSDLLKQKLHIDSCFQGQVGDEANKFFEYKDKFDWFINTRFELGEIRIKIPFLHKKEDKYELYFLYYGTEIKDLDLFSYRINVQVLEKLGILVEDVSIAYINPNYVFHNTIQPEELFLLTNENRNHRIIDRIHESFVDYEEIIERIKASEVSECEPVKTRLCHNKSLCPYYSDCFKEEEKLPDDSILTLVSSQYKTKMYEEGILSLKDVDETRLEGNRVQFAQIMASKNGGLFVDELNLKQWVNTIQKGPVSYIDFEWDRYLIPSYEGMKPLDVIPFEFALYFDKGDGKLEHRTFLSSGDCRKEFAETLMEALPQEGPIFAYNAEGAEILRIKELAELFPEYKEELIAITKRFVDLATPFIEGMVYDVRMAGNYTLKKLVSVVSDMTYKDLEIDDGMSAVFNWRDIDKGKDIDENKVMEDLKKYCSLDAYGLHLVYMWLKNLVK